MRNEEWGGSKNDNLGLKCKLTRIVQFCLHSSTRLDQQSLGRHRTDIITMFFRRFESFLVHLRFPNGLDALSFGVESWSRWEHHSWVTWPPWLHDSIDSILRISSRAWSKWTFQAAWKLWNCTALGKFFVAGLQTKNVTNCSIWKCALVLWAFPTCLVCIEIIEILELGIWFNQPADKQLQHITIRDLAQCH